MQKKTLLTILCIGAILVGLFLFNQDRRSTDRSETTKHQNNRKNGGSSSSPADHQNRSEEFDRQTSKIIYTKHARCRMDCRHIDEAEVREILEKGIINREKSDPASKPDPKYALEGFTRDGQEVRIIFAPAENGMVVITVIDLQKEWSCNCK
jgi:hypothetical protein